MHYYPMSFIRVRRIRVAKCLRATPGTAECASHRVQSPEHATELIGCSSAIQIDIWSQVPRSRIIGMWLFAPHWPSLRIMLQAQSSRDLNLWQACQEISKKSSKIV